MQPVPTQSPPLAPPAHARHARAAPPGIVLSFVVYAALFAALAAPWLAAAQRGGPSGYLGNAADERLVVWVLAWVAHAAATEPARVLDANINYPAPGQLTGTEHFFSFQVLFAPLYALTRNPLLAANLTVFLTYPLAALAMQRLLLVLGCASGVAWVVGAMFALGPYRAPANLHLLQYSNLFLPLVALALTRLRERATGRNAALLGLALALTALSSYYMAVLGAVVAALWAIFELRRGEAPRARFVTLAMLTALLVGAAVLVVSLPYLSRPEVGSEFEWSLRRALQQEYMFGLFARAAIGSGGTLALVLAGLGVVAFLSPDVRARRCAARGLCFVVLGQIMAHGAVLTVDGVAIPTPFALIASTPLHFFRYPTRFALLVGFGGALLCAAGLQAAYVHLGRRAGRIAVALIAVILIATQGRRLPGLRITEFKGQTEPVYEMVARFARARGAGPLLELPYLPPVNRDEAEVVGTEGDSMLGSTRHWLPLVLGTTGYQPPHRSLVLREVRELPDAHALARLVDMTGLRWILLHPTERWPARERAQREKIRTSPLLKQVASQRGWVLLRVKEPPRSTAWFDAIATGPRPDRTLLGTPLAAIGEELAVARVRGVIVPSVELGTLAYAALLVRNVGAATWPVSVADARADRSHVVRLAADWRPAGAPAGAAATWSTVTSLPSDVPPGDLMRFGSWLQPPDAPGEYDVTLRIEQVGGATFSAPGNEPLHARVRVVLASPK